MEHFNYELHSDVRGRKKARELVNGLHGMASTLDFLWVGHVYEITGRQAQKYPHPLLNLQILENYCNEKKSYVPKGIIVFEVCGEDRQAGAFGLCCYPQRKDVTMSKGFFGGISPFRNIIGWHWNGIYYRQDCYIRMIEFARELGILEQPRRNRL